MNLNMAVIFGSLAIVSVGVSLFFMRSIFPGVLVFFGGFGLFLNRVVLTYVSMNLYNPDVPFFEHIAAFSRAQSYITVASYLAISFGVLLLGLRLRAHNRPALGTA